METLEQRLNERLVGVAIYQNEEVHCLPRPARHSDLMRFMIERGLDVPVTGIQGFITNTNRFVSRAAAHAIAESAGQLINGAKGGNYLISEMVW